MQTSRSISLLWIGCAALLLLAAGGQAWGQNASIGGIVTDTSGAVVPNAQAVLTNRATREKFATVTNKVGLYTLAGVMPGAYDLTVSLSGFKTEQRTGIVVDVGARISLDVQLSVGSPGEEVTVNGGGQSIDTTDASVSTVVNRQFVENLPLNGRSFQSLITVAPGTEVVPSQGQGSSGEISVNGQRTEANYYTVDGISADTGATVTTGGFIGAGFSGATPQESALVTTQSIISIDALEEFRESTSTYSAEYGRTPGGQFSFISRSGTNQYHGSAYDFLRNDAMDAKNYFDTTKLPERQNDFGGTLGGPIRIPHLYNGHDKTFFFFSYEALRLQNPQAAQLYNVPSNAFRQAVSTQQPDLVPYIAAFPVTNNPDLGNGLANYTAGYSAPSDLDDRNVRVDHSFNDRFKLFGRYTDVPSNSLLRQPTDLAQVNNTVRNVKMAVGGLDSVLGNSLENELRFGLSGNDYKSQRYLDNFGGATPLSIGTAPGLTNGDWMTFFLFYGLYPYYLIEPQSNRQRQINVVDSFTQTLGRHTLKYGVDYRRLVTSEELPPLWEVAFYFDEAAVLSNAPAGLYVYTQSINMKSQNVNFSAYVQDDWKIADRLSASLGLRWDVNPAPSDLDGNQPYTVT
ncbi:MAG: carboxypeptidase-like regulatory domain-containing protein, partial [Terracidiphilus sp.]